MDGLSLESLAHVRVTLAARRPHLITHHRPAVCTQGHSCSSLHRRSGGRWPAASTEMRCWRFRFSTTAKSSATSKHGAGGGGQPDSDSSRITYNRTLDFETIFQGLRATYLAPFGTLKVPWALQPLSVKSSSPSCPPSIPCPFKVTFASF